MMYAIKTEPQFYQGTLYAPTPSIVCVTADREAAEKLAESLFLEQRGEMMKHGQAGPTHYHVIEVSDAVAARYQSLGDYLDEYDCLVEAHIGPTTI